MSISEKHLKALVAMDRDPSGISKFHKLTKSTAKALVEAGCVVESEEGHRITNHGVQVCFLHYNKQPID